MVVHRGLERCIQVWGLVGVLQEREPDAVHNYQAVERREIEVTGMKSLLVDLFRYLRDRLALGWATRKSVLNRRKGRGK